MVNVTKADGSKQPFERDKIVRTCMRMRLNKDDAQEVADRIENKIYEGISTGQILKMIFTYTTGYRPAIKHQIDLREAICLLSPKPDFEKFVGLLLKAEGYDVKTNQIVRGRCIEHEIDAIATKNDEKNYIEVKHHYQYHSFTGVDVFLETAAIFEDMDEANNNFSKAMVITNGKISEHAIRYAACKKIDAIGWRYPDGGSLESRIEKHRLYPITFIRGLNADVKDRLGDNGIILLQQLVTYDAHRLSKITKIGKSQVKEILGKAEIILTNHKND